MNRSRESTEAEINRLKRELNDPYNQDKWVERDRIKELERELRDNSDNNRRSW